ncbi:Zinc finger protein 2, partial [Araneus ventricosus]
MAEGTPEENHEKIVELDKKTNICETCNTIFYNEKEFGQHLLTHVTEKAYQCGVCDGYFTFKRSLIQHLLTHTGTFTECLVCNKKFGLNVTQHLLTRHVKKTPYMCHSCNMAFWKRNSLDKHLNDNRIHKRAYACHVCKKKCTKRLCLKRHLKTHARCHLCDKSFPDSRILDEHMLLHRERVYLACNMCNEVFEDVSALRYHIYIHIESSKKVRHITTNHCTIVACGDVVSASRLEGDRLETGFHQKSAVCVGLVHAKSDVEDQTSSLWCGAEVWQ